MTCLAFAPPIVENKSLWLTHSFRRGFCFVSRRLAFRRSFPGKPRAPNSARRIACRRCASSIRKSLMPTCGWRGAKRGLAVTVQVEGKKHALWARESSIEDSDGLQLWIDTRDTHNIHRASRFCHRFAFLPAGGGRGTRRTGGRSTACRSPRAKNANPDPARHAEDRLPQNGHGLSPFRLDSGRRPDGLQPCRPSKLGFTYYLFDREFGEQSFSVGSQFPFAADPSLWGTLDLAPLLNRTLRAGPRRRRAQIIAKDPKS